MGAMTGKTNGEPLMAGTNYIKVGDLVEWVTIENDYERQLVDNHEGYIGLVISEEWLLYGYYSYSVLWSDGYLSSKLEARYLSTIKRL